MVGCLACALMAVSFMSQASIHAYEYLDTDWERSGGDPLPEEEQHRRASHAGVMPPSEQFRQRVELIRSLQTTSDIIGFHAHCMSRTCTSPRQSAGYCQCMISFCPVRPTRHTHTAYNGVLNSTIILPSRYGIAARGSTHGSATNEPGQVAAIDEPLVLQNTFATQLPAMKLWTVEHIIKHMDQLEGVKIITRRATDQDTPFFYNHGSPMSSVNTLVGNYVPTAYTRVNMSAAEFFQRWNDTTQSTAVSHSCFLHELPSALSREFQPVEPFVVVQPGVSPEDNHLHRQTRVWFSGARTTTPAHFDLFHNFFIQVHGHKRFLLYPPARWQQLYMWPILHPAGRSMQVDLNGDYEDQQRRFPNFRRRAEALEVVVGPGDVLYIPPLWIHHVTSLEASISVSVWTQNPAIETAAQAFEQLPLPIKRAWSRDQQLAALRLSLQSLIASLQLDMTTAEFVDWTLLQNRYLHVGSVTEPEGRFCEQPDLTSDLLLEEEELFRAHVRSLLRVFQNVRRLGGFDRMVIELANYFELATNSILAVEDVKQFFHDLVIC
ncbi:uncharacterized protein MONBRDRAFT_33410 [Monosiga brevicollis MX1]|uniref:JmjC domain-containing protein n=1 Tax=Monosiga brevicollis TaxID=81824 RepID=A9V590_MONBE|nr:uncharacterized protein MONBRDRAFT_33410 [Monosiga brevicollis MX1]EDQ87336.1 predicted protein [Monosiga brevicollis MX1]|eukprot:XP_001747949.1 hypothetical protein [Monosiga brevicollis MX1]